MSIFPFSAPLTSPKNAQLEFTDTNPPPVLSTEQVLVGVEGAAGVVVEPVEPVVVVCCCCRSLRNQKRSQLIAACALKANDNPTKTKLKKKLFFTKFLLLIVNLIFIISIVRSTFKCNTGFSA